VTTNTLDPLTALATRVGEALSARQLRLVTAESCTGGWIAKAITDIAGSSGWFDRGFVTYSNLSKQELLGVSGALIDDHGAVSEAVVLAMAEGALRGSPAEAAVAVSGIAGPGGGTPDKPVGTVWIAWALTGTPPEAIGVELDGDRERVRRETVRLALQGLLERLGSAYDDPSGSAR
jgi:nicotinamide-nucleotide amidase